MKTLTSTLSSLLLLAAVACGGNPGEVPTSSLDTTQQELPCETCEPGGGGGGDDDDTPPIIVHGYEINLPLLNPSKMPPGWCTVDIGYGEGHVFRCADWGRGTMDWGGGNAVFHVNSSGSWYSSSEFYNGRIFVEVPKAEGFVPIAQTLGFYTHPQNVPGLVRGSVEMLALKPNPSEVILAVQVNQSGVWTDVATSRSTITNIRQMHELQALVYPNQEVRFEVRAKARPDAYSEYFLWKVRMFGAQCYPDFSNGTGCL
ncbi:hypothetical protein MYSTI_07590 [Myxococcus stipitatus DSM 14675]|uniref:Lipoprotein n=1 Tax=Myxococcus stipitatus (strain DSM 14675 / JCM 12634 / Mx s8) TaxID=1278073 RepID=L7UMT0_MYXSD|nr:hypothetical protein [Myxococcus stipitatus]AGC48862.1 hypothetical protein MYSTI_07590 [Myxococcus stipitatus DSM 14675]